MAASLAIWVLTALLAGEATFVETPRADAEGFLVLLLHVQFISYVLLLIWSIVLQVMGFSEIQGLATRKAFGSLGRWGRSSGSWRPCFWPC